MEYKDILGVIRKSERVKVIIDSDAYNEIDDQYAIAYALLTTERLQVLSINAAPFQNSRAQTPKLGMERSYDEIFKIMGLSLPSSADFVPVHRGSERFMRDSNDIIESCAADNIVTTVMSSEETVFIIAIGAITNVAQAYLKEPGIAQRCCVIWLGGHALNRPDTREFNLKQDVCAAQIVMNSPIPLIQIPCIGVCSEFVTTPPELEYYLKGKNELCDYLYSITGEYIKWGYAKSKVIWDVTAVGVLTTPEAFEIVELPRPIITSDCRYAFDSAREHYLYVRRIKRDPLYASLFYRLSNK